MKTIDNIVKMLPKGELHVHLNGILSTSLVKRLLLNENVQIPDGFSLDRDLTRIKPTDSLSEYLKPWQLLRLIPSNRANLKILIDNVFYNLNEDNVKFVELRNSVIYLALNCGISVTEAMKWLIEEIEVQSTNYSIRAGLILTVTRGEDSLGDLMLLTKAFNRLGNPKIILGLDLAGNEDINVPDTLGNQFKNAKDKFGFKVTIHAGETGKKENILKAVDVFGADRIGHGTAAGLCVETMTILREREVCVEVCPISNRLTGAVKEAESHPALNFIKHKVPFVICSDNPGIHSKTLSDDYLEFLKETESMACIENMYMIQKKYTFLN